MAGPEGNPTPRDPSPMADEEVDRLLREAEALTDEISNETGVENRNEDVAPADADPDAPVDVEAAAERASNRAREVADVLSDDEGDAPKGGAASAESASGRSADAQYESPELADASTDEAGAPTEEPPDVSTAKSGLRVEHDPKGGDSPHSGDRASAAELPPLTSRNADSIKPAPPRPRASTPAAAAAAPEAESGESSTEAGAGEATQPASRSSVKAGLTASLGFARRCGSAALFALPNACLGALILLDRPFAGLSANTKRRIGLMGIVTVVMGMLSFVLPILLADNPYKDMPPYPQ